MYNVFLLDADETILDFARSSEESLAEAMRSFGLPYRAEDFAVYKKINDGIWKEYEQGKLTKAQLMNMRFVRFFRYLGIRADADAVNARYFAALSSAGYLLEGALPFIEALKMRGKVYLITNGTPAAQYGRLDSLGIRRIFDGIFVSDEIGAAKPSKKFFDYVLSSTGADPQTSLVIGDSLSSDIAGAANAGLHCIWYNPSGASSAGFRPTYEANSYAQILHILDEELRK